MTRDDHRVFTCVVCGCRFRHNPWKWLVCLPLVTGIALVRFLFLKEYASAAALGAITAAGSLTNRISNYRIISRGEFTPSEANEVVELHDVSDEKESRWFLALLFLILAAIAAFFVYAIREVAPR
jgi:hypothetical protein